MFADVRVYTGNSITYERRYSGPFVASQKFCWYILAEVPTLFRKVPTWL